MTSHQLWKNQQPQKSFSKVIKEIFDFVAGQYIYWSAEEIPENPYTVIDTITEIEPRQDYPHETRAVQATGN